MAGGSNRSICYPLTMESLRELVNIQSSGALAFWVFILVFVFIGVAGMVVGLLRRHRHRHEE